MITQVGICSRNNTVAVEVGGWREVCGLGWWGRAVWECVSEVAGTWKSEIRDLGLPLLRLVNSLL